jgi:hypothetical protein
MAGGTCGGAGRRTKGKPAMFLLGTGSEFGTGGGRGGGPSSRSLRGWRSRLLRQTSEKVDSRARGSRARFRRKPGSPRWTRASAGTSSVMVSFGETGTGSLGTAPVESDDRRAATVKRWVAGGEEVGSSADRHPRAQKKENRRAGSPAGTAALNVATAPVKKLQTSLRRGYNREHDEYKILWRPLRACADRLATFHTCRFSERLSGLFITH